MMHDVNFDESKFPFITLGNLPKELFCFEEDTKHSDTTLTKARSNVLTTITYCDIEDDKGQRAISPDQQVIFVVSDHQVTNAPPEVCCSSQTQTWIDYSSMTISPSVSLEIFDILGSVFSGAVTKCFTPRSYKETTQDPPSSFWIEACNEEIKSFRKNNLYETAERLVNKRLLRVFCIFNTITNLDGSPRYKACFVVMGNLQIKGIDYFDTFSPTRKPSSLHLLFAFAAIDRWEVHQMDAVTAFLKMKLDTEVYMEIPEGFSHEFLPGKFCRLKNSLYGLRYSPKLWYDNVAEYFIQVDFEKCFIEPCT